MPISKTLGLNHVESILQIDKINKIKAYSQFILDKYTLIFVLNSKKSKSVILILVKD